MPGGARQRDGEIFFAAQHALPKPQFALRLECPGPGKATLREEEEGVDGN